MLVLKDDPTILVVTRDTGGLPVWWCAGSSPTLPGVLGPATPGAGVAGAAPAGEADGEAAAAGRRPRVLIVEDELIIAWLLTEIVQGLGYEVCGNAAAEDEAVRLAASMRPDLILMDVSLRGDGDGIRATQAIRAAMPTVPVVFCSAYASDPATRARMEAVGAADILPKPVEARQLGPLLERLLGEDPA